MSLGVNRNTSIEFIVRPKQDLHLQGQLRKLHRIDKGEAYPCQMQKNQNFSCLFRHYAKHNGLKKEDLIFSFVDELLPEQTPETVHLMPGDEIWVEHRTPDDEKDEKPSTPASPFSSQFRTLLDTGNHSDIIFVVGDSETEIHAHKSIISARSHYFEAMFRIGGMMESTSKSVSLQQDVATFRRMLEFLYTDCIQDIATLTSAEITLLLEMANEYVLTDLRTLAELFASKLVSKENLSKFLLMTGDDSCSVLRSACIMFMQDNIVELRSDHKFRQDVEKSPELGLFLYEASIPQHSENSQDSFDMNKRRRISQELPSAGDLLDNNNSSNNINNSMIVPGANNVAGGTANTIAQTNMNVND